MTLDMLEKNETAVVTSLKFDKKDCKRLRDMGLFEGRNIRFAFASPFLWPRAYDVQGIIIALRKEEAERIGIKKEDRQ